MPPRAMKSIPRSFLFLLPCLLACGAPTLGDPPLEDGATPGAPVSGGYDPAVRACTRLHGECRQACEGLWGYDCYDDVPSCVENYTIDYTPSFDDPMIDEERARRCGEQVEQQPCDWLEPDSLECEFSIVERCADDGDALGRPYSPFLATDVKPGAEVVIDLCPGVPEFFALQLEAGTRLDVHRTDEGRVASAELHRLETTSSGEAVLQEYRLDEPVPEAGEYLVRLKSSYRVVQAVMFAVHGASGE